MSEISVLHIASWYPNPQDERLGNFVEEHLKALKEKQAVVVLSAFEAQEEKIEIKEEPFLQIQVHYQKKWPIWSHYQALKRGYLYLMNKGHLFDMAHLHVTWPSGIVFLGFLKKLPFVITEHYSGYQKSRLHEWSRWGQFLALRIMNRASLVLPVSKQLGDSLKSFGVSTEQKVIGNVVDPKTFHYQVPEAPDTPFRLLHISSLQEETKNIKGLIAGFARALAKDEDLHLSIGGDGDLDRLKMELKRQSIPTSQYTILPALSRQEVAEVMAASHAFVLFSHIENQPVVLLESLCVGRPIIATKVGGISEFIGPNEGLLVAPKNESELAEAILSLKQNYPQYALEDLAKSAQAKHSFAAIAEEFRSCYTNVRPLDSWDRRCLDPGQ